MKRRRFTSVMLSLVLITSVLGSSFTEISAIAAEESVMEDAPVEDNTYDDKS